MFSGYVQESRLGQVEESFVRLRAKIFLQISDYIIKE